MLKKSLMLLIVLLLSGAVALKSQTNNLTNVILTGYSARTYTAKPVTDSEIDMIVKCGMKAPSARNLQPWKFIVVKSDSLVKEAIPDATSGNIVIVVLGLESAGQGLEFDCGLATESMFIAALSLGLGARIYGSPVKNVNSKRQLFGIPEGYRAVTLLRIGNIDKNVDATSAASTRKKTEEVVIYR